MVGGIVVKSGEGEVCAGTLGFMRVSNAESCSFAFLPFVAYGPDKHSLQP